MMQTMTKFGVLPRPGKIVQALQTVVVSIIVIFPIAVFLLATAGLALPFSRSTTLWLFAENNLVEMFTFFFLLAAGLYGLYLFRLMRKRNENWFYTGFNLLFSCGLILTAMEEIAWGQQLLAFNTPLSIQEINMQGETTIHNIRGLHGNTDYLRFAFASAD